MLYSMFPKLKNILFFGCLLVIIFVAVHPAMAVDLTDVKNSATQGGLALFDNFGDIFGAVLAAALDLAFVVAVITIVIAGYRLVTSGGNEQKLEKAKQHLLWGIIGIIVIALAYFIVILVLNTVKSGAAPADDLNVFNRKFYI